MRDSKGGNMENIYNKTKEELKTSFEKAYRANQVFDWLYKQRIKDLSEINNMKRGMVEFIIENFYMETVHLETMQSDKDVNKFLFKLHDGNHVEAVLMHHDYGNSLCVSTQVGCNMGCRFCESGRLKKKRNLEPYEMVTQILKVEEEMNLRISHIVIMGIGEPFDNFENVMKFIDIINDNNGLAIGARHITVSTCGVVPKIDAFAELPKQVNLAISLHAPNDALRNKLMPINKAYNLKMLMDSIKRYVMKTNRRVTFEYILLSGINDSKEHAIELSELIRGINCYVNLIPYNTTSHNAFQKSDKTMQFYDILKKRKINVTIRKEFGSKVDAACGQLRASYEEE